MARLLVAALLLPSGIDKLLHFSRFVGSLAAKGVPYAKVVAALDVAVEVVGPVALIVGLWPMWTALILIGFMAVTTWTTYRFGMFTAVFRQPQPRPVDEEPRRHGGPPVLRGERTRSLEPNRLTKSLKVRAAPLNGWQQAAKKAPGSGLGAGHVPSLLNQYRE